MTKSFKIGTVYRDDFPELCEALCSAFPAGDKGLYFSYYGPFDDDLISLLTGILHNNGWTKAFTGQIRTPKQYNFVVRRDYAEKDLKDVEFFRVESPSFRNCDSVRRPDGSIVVSESEYRISGRVTVTMEGRVIIDSSLHSAIIEQGLLGAAFYPAELDRKKNNKAGHLWELTSEIVLPKMSPSTIFSDPTFGERPGFISLEEPPYTGPEFHYQAHAFDSLPPFDFAITREVLDGSDRGQLVVSARFRKLAKKLGARVTWIPVRFDEPAN